MGIVPRFFSRLFGTAQPRADEGVFSLAMSRKNFASIADVFGVWLFLGALFSLFVCGSSAYVTQDATTGLRVVGLGLLLGGASFVCGWLLGLLFGIPRTLARPQPLVGADRSPPTAQAVDGGSVSRVNTNLEDVSDWLTKTLIGVGLTQLYILPSKLWAIAGALNAKGFGWNEHGQLMALSLILYFAPGGFWLGYVATRTVLTKLFDSIEEVGKEADIVLAKDQLKLTVEGDALAQPTDPEVTRADTALVRMPMHAMATPQQLAAWGVAKARAGQIETGVIALEEAREAAPSEPSISDALAKLYTIQKRPPDAQRLLRSIPPTDTAVWWALYEDTPEGFRRAITIGEKLLAESSAPNLNLRVWMACAYGQQHAYAVQTNDDALARHARSQVLRNAEAAIAIDLNARGWLEALWKPTPGSGDDDLSSLGDDPELASLLTGSPAKRTRPASSTPDR